MITELNIEQTREMLVAVAKKIIAGEPLLTEIDSKTGDGDHGICMELGFSAVCDELLKINGAQLLSVNAVFKFVGSTLIDTMGGASGVLFGTLFISGATAAKAQETLTLPMLAAMLEKSSESIQTRGKARPGDKTMVDALAPAVEALNRSCAEKFPLGRAIALAAKASADGAKKTKGYMAKFGRAKTFGEKAIGFADAGATSVSLIFEAMREYIEALEEDAAI